MEAGIYIFGAIVIGSTLLGIVINFKKSVISGNQFGPFGEPEPELQARFQKFEGPEGSREATKLGSGSVSVGQRSEK